MIFVLPFSFMDVEFSEDPLPSITNDERRSTHDSELETPPIAVTKKVVASKKQQGHQDPSKDKEKKKLQKEEVIDLTDDIATSTSAARPHAAAAKTGTAATTTASHTKDKDKVMEVSSVVVIDLADHIATLPHEMPSDSSEADSDAATKVIRLCELVDCILISSCYSS